MYCGKHKKLYVVHPRCQEIDCKTRPPLIFKTKQKKYCIKHKKDNIIDVLNTRCKKGYYTLLKNMKDILYAMFFIIITNIFFLKFL